MGGGKSAHVFLIKSLWRVEKSVINSGKGKTRLSWPKSVWFWFETLRGVGLGLSQEGIATVCLIPCKALWQSPRVPWTPIAFTRQQSDDLSVNESETYGLHFPEKIDHLKKRRAKCLGKRIMGSVKAKKEVNYFRYSLNAKCEQAFRGRHSTGVCIYDRVNVSAWEPHQDDAHPCVVYGLESAVCEQPKRIYTDKTITLTSIKHWKLEFSSVSPVRKPFPFPILTSPSFFFF